MIQLQGFPFLIFLALLSFCFSSLSWATETESDKAFLGVSYAVEEKLDQMLGKGFSKGILIHSIIEGSSAQKSGLRKGDIIVGYGQHDPSTMATDKLKSHFKDFIKDQKVGDRVLFKIVRRKTIYSSQSQKKEALLEDKEQLDLILDQQKFGETYHLSVSKKLLELDFLIELGKKETRDPTTVPNNETLFPEYETLKKVTVVELLPLGFLECLGIFFYQKQQ